MLTNTNRIFPAAGAYEFWHQGWRGHNPAGHVIFDEKIDIAAGFHRPEGLDILDTVVSAGGVVNGRAVGQSEDGDADGVERRISRIGDPNGLLEPAGLRLKVHRG